MADNSYVYQFRLILIGESTVGKSSLLRHFKDGEYFADISLTVGVDFHAKQVQINGQTIKLQLWDTAGQDRFRAIVKAYYRNAVGGLLVFDITHRESFARLNDWLEDAMKHAEPHKPVFVLVGNKTDQEKIRAVSQEEAQKFARLHHMEYIETSAKTGQNVDEAFQLLASKIYQMLSEGYIKVEEGWDGVKRGEGVGADGKKRILYRDGTPYNGTVSFHGNVNLNRPNDHSKKKCCG